MKKPVNLLVVLFLIFAIAPHSPAKNSKDSIIARDSVLAKNFEPSKESALSKDSTVSIVAIKNAPEPPTPLSNIETLGGNLPKNIAAKKQPYFVTSDIYVPSGKTVTIGPGVVLLFKNFTGMHVEGRLIAEGTKDKPIIFSSEFDQTYNTGTTLHANPYDWNGIYIHESGIGSTLAYCKIEFSVYGITALTRYIKFDNVLFLSNGRSDLTIEGKKPTVTSEPYSYTLTVNDAKRDGVPVNFLMDPNANKRSIIRYSGLSLLAGGSTMGLLWSIQAGNDNKRLIELGNTTVTDQNSNLVHNSNADYNTAQRDKNRDIGLSVAGFVLAIIGGAGLGFSFTF